MANRNAPQSTCAVSVIIPLYNAEKYIRQCLISVLASKFTDYEVLVVDDCSTDNSVAAVKKLLPHFEGRLRLLRTEKNSGGAGIPRNVGIKDAAGKYLTFIDNDDMLVPTALGDFFELAEKFQADVVHTDKRLYLEEGSEDKRFKLTFTETELVEEPLLESAELNERIRRYVAKKFYWLPWGKFYRRDFLRDNKIDFPQMYYSEDMIFCFKCLCLAKNYLRVPNVTNIHSIRRGSASKRLYSTANEGVNTWLSVMTIGIALIDKFMSRLEFFTNNPSARGDVLKFFVDEHLRMNKSLLVNMTLHEIQKIFFEELQNPKLDERGKNLIAAYLYTERVFKR